MKKDPHEKRGNQAMNERISRKKAMKKHEKKKQPNSRNVCVCKRVCMQVQFISYGMLTFYHFHNQCVPIFLVEFLSISLRSFAQLSVNLNHE